MTLRLSHTDALVLRMECATNPSHINLLGILGGNADPAALEQRITECLPRFPRLTRRIARGRRPELVPDPAFDPRRHIIQIRMPHSAGRDELFRATAWWAQQPYDFAHPPWRIVLFTRKHSNMAARPPGECMEAGVLWSVHHAFTDALGYFAFLRALCSTDKPQLDAEEPARPCQPSGIRARLGAGLRFTRQFLDDVFTPPTPSPLQGFNSTARCWLTIDFSRADLRAIMRRFQCSLTELLLAIVTGAARRYHLRHGAETARNLSAFVPQSTRTRADANNFGNHIVTFRVPLPIAEPAPEQRLRRAQDAASRLAADRSARMTQWLAAAICHLPSALQMRIARMPGRMTNLLCTILPVHLCGRTFAGAKVLSTPGTAPLPISHGAGFTFIVDIKTIFGTICCDPNIVPDPPALLDCTRESLAEYLSMCNG